MVIMAMDHIGPVLPLVQPVANGHLESQEAFGIVVVTIYFFAVQQSVDVDQVQVEPKLIGLFLDHRVMKGKGTELLIALVHQFPLVLV